MSKWQQAQGSLTLIRRWFGDNDTEVEVWRDYDGAWQWDVRASCSGTAKTRKAAKAAAKRAGKLIAGAVDEAQGDVEGAEPADGGARKWFSTEGYG